MASKTNEPSLRWQRQCRVKHPSRSLRRIISLRLEVRLQSKKSHVGISSSLSNFARSISRSSERANPNREGRGITISSDLAEVTVVPALRGGLRVQRHDGGVSRLCCRRSRLSLDFGQRDHSVPTWSNGRSGGDGSKMAAARKRTSDSGSGWCARLTRQSASRGSKRGGRVVLGSRRGRRHRRP